MRSAQCQVQCWYAPIRGLGLGRNRGAGDWGFISAKKLNWGTAVFQHQPERPSGIQHVAGPRRLTPRTYIKGAHPTVLEVKLGRRLWRYCLNQKDNRITSLCCRQLGLLLLRGTPSRQRRILWLHIRGGEGIIWKSLRIFRSGCSGRILVSTHHLSQPRYHFLLSVFSE
jgi:hypothetical protein